MFSFSILCVFFDISKRVLTQPGQVNAKWADCVTVGMCHNRSHCNDKNKKICSFEIMLSRFEFQFFIIFLLCFTVLEAYKSHFESFRVTSNNFESF